MENINIENILPDMKTLTLDKTPRPQQIEMLEFTKESILANKKHILLNGPPGVGKSYFLVMFMDWFNKNYDRNATFDILTDSKILQEQYTRDYDFINSLWGKGSYECDKYQTDCASGMEFCKLQKRKKPKADAYDIYSSYWDDNEDDSIGCKNCPYKLAKYKFDNGKYSLSNFHLFLTYKLYMPQAWQRSSRVLVIDEADSFEQVTCDFISTKISKPLLKANGFNDDEIIRSYDLFGQFPEDLTIQEFAEIVDNEFLDIARTVLNRLIREETVLSMKKAQSLGNNLMKWEKLLTSYNEDPKNWILETENVKKYNGDNKLTDQYYEFSAEPVWSMETLKSEIWSKYDYVIMMSGTLLNKRIICDINGLDFEKTAYKDMDSPFPIENRPIYYFYDLGKQTFTNKQETWKNQLPVLKKIMKKHKNDKGIIHTANYEIQNWVANGINENRILAHTSDDRNDILNFHYNSQDPTVLVSPSMTTGVDLSENFSRHQTVLKIPYPHLGSKRIKKRMETHKDWYSWKTVAELIQSYGRSIRAVDDKADTYILDGSFSNVLRFSDKFIPKWFKDAIKYIK